MDRGSWQATVHEVAKELDATEQLTFTFLSLDPFIVPSVSSPLNWSQHIHCPASYPKSRFFVLLCCLGQHLWPCGSHLPPPSWSVFPGDCYTSKWKYCTWSYKSNNSPGHMKITWDNVTKSIFWNEGFIRSHSFNYSFMPWIFVKTILASPASSKQDAVKEVMV